MNTQQLYSAHFRSPVFNGKSYLNLKEADALSINHELSYVQVNIRSKAFQVPLANVAYWVLIEDAPEGHAPQPVQEPEVKAKKGG